MKGAHLWRKSVSGPETVTISGYQDTDMCGIYMSEKGAQVMTFGCKIGPDELSLNNVGVWTGEVKLHT